MLRCFCFCSPSLSLSESSFLHINGKDVVSVFLCLFIFHCSFCLLFCAFLSLLLLPPLLPLSSSPFFLHILLHSCIFHQCRCHFAIRKWNFWCEMLIGFNLTISNTRLGKWKAKNWFSLSKRLNNARSLCRSVWAFFNSIFYWFHRNSFWPEIISWIATQNHRRNKKIPHEIGKSYVNFYILHQLSGVINIGWRACAACFNQFKWTAWFKGIVVNNII